MSAKPTELKKLIKLLDEEAPSAEWLATEVFNMVEEMLIAREQYVVVVMHPTLKLVQAVGPWYSKTKLMKEWPKYVGAYDDTSRAAVALLKHMSKIE